MLQSHSEPENSFLDKEGRILSAIFSVTFNSVEGRAAHSSPTTGQQAAPHIFPCE